MITIEGAWEVKKVLLCDQLKAEVYLDGINHFEIFKCGYPPEFFWRVGWRSFEDIGRAKRLFDFSGAVFERGAKDRLAAIVGEERLSEMLDYKHNTKARAAELDRYGYERVSDA